MRQEAARPDLVERLIAIVDQRWGHSLAGRVEQARIAMTEEPTAHLDVDLTEARFGVDLTREGFEATIQDAVERVADTVAQTLRDAGVAASDISTVFLTGGSTATPLARRSILDARATSARGRRRHLRQRGAGPGAGRTAQVRVIFG